MYRLTGRVHATWHFTAACFGVVAGVACAQLWSGFSHGGWLAIGLALIAFSLWKQWRVLLAVAFVAGSVVGLWRGSIDQNDIARFAAVYGKHAVVTGTVKDDVELNRRGQSVMRLGDLRVGDSTVTGMIYATTKSSADIKRSDTVVLDGQLDEGFGNFAATMYSAKLVQVRRETGKDPLLGTRDGLADNVRATVDEPAASLGIGYLFGQKRALPPDLQEALMVAGLTHIVVASGYNLTILVRLTRRLFARVSKYLAMLTSGTLVVSFIAMTGLSPSMTRAGIVAGLALWAWYYGRKFHPVTLLGVASAATVLWNPSFAWGDVGWLLSFTAFAGVMLVAPLMKAYFYGKEQQGTVSQILFETVAAQLTTAPIILVVFGQFSNVAVLGNLLVLPFIPLAMLLTAIAAIGGMLPAWAGVVGWPAEVLLGAMIAVVEWCAALPGAQMEVKFPWWGVLAWYGVVVLGCVYAWRVTGYKLRDSSIVE